MNGKIYICNYQLNNKYAEGYCEGDPDEIYDYRKHIKCPECNKEILYGIWKKPYSISISKKNIPDFLYTYGGTECPFLISENVAKKLKDSNLTGIISIEEVDNIKFQRTNSMINKIPKYYYIRIAHSLITIDHSESKIAYGMQNDSPNCLLCNPKSCTYDFIKSISFNMDNYEGYDIFHIYELGNATFLSSRFIEFCKENKFTNLCYNDLTNYDDSLSDIFSEEELCDLFNTTPNGLK